MAGIRSLILKSLSKPVSFSSKSLSLRLHESGTTFSKYAADHGLKGPLYASMNHNYHTRPRFMGRFPVTHSRVLCLEYPVGIRSYKTSHDKVISPTMSNLRIQHIAPLFVLGRMSDYRFYSSSSGNNKAQAGYSVSESNISGDHIDGSGVVDKVKEALQSLVDPSSYTAKKATEASDELIPLVQQLLNSHPYLKDFVVPVGCTLTGVVLAWTVMPKLLRRFHKYAMQSSTTLLYGGSSEGEKIPYEQSLWGALEDPIRYLITFMAFSQIGMMVAPTTIASEYISQTWRGGVILSCVWFLHRWKSNVFARVLTSPSLLGLDREKLVALDKVSSVGLFVLGLMALAEACGVAVQSILTVGGIGGVATAFAARDILGNVLSGLSMQFSKPFSIGDTIKAGSVEGQVIEMGLTTTLLLNAEKFPVIVPNSLFSSQVIVNKSRAQWRAMVIKIPVRIDDLGKIPKISNDVKTMLRSNENIFLGKEAPYCFMSYVESSHAQLNLGCNLKHMSKDEFYSTQEDILLQSVQIIKQHGGTLGSSLQEIISR